jgi:diketogulonate reductase-like aldo/keto reductase
LVADQVHYSLVKQDPGAELLPYCQGNEIILISYTPLARGKLARPGNPVLDELAEKYGRTHAQVSLNWLISQENVVAARAVGWMLDKDD